MRRRGFLKRAWVTSVLGTAQKVFGLSAKPGKATRQFPVLPHDRLENAKVLSPQSAVILFRDDFSGFPVGWLSRPLREANGAIQAYHYLSNRGVPLGSWANAICQMDAWVVGDEEGKPYLEQHMINDLAVRMNPMFVTGDAEWSDYTVEVNVKPLSFANMAGIVFRCHTNRHYYLFALTGGNEARLVVREPLRKLTRSLNGESWESANFTITRRDTTP